MTLHKGILLTKHQEFINIDLIDRIDELRISIERLRNEYCNEKVIGKEKDSEKETFEQIEKYVNMKPAHKMSFIACNNEDVMYMLDYLVNVTKDIK